MLSGTNVVLSVTVAGGGAAPSLPSVSSGTLQLWLKADTGVVTNASGQVSQWQDQSGNANHASQGNTNNQPLLVYPPAIGGRPAVRFNGIQDGINGDYLHGTQDVGVPDAMTSFALYNAITAANVNVIWLVGVPGLVYGASRCDDVFSGELDFSTWAYHETLPFEVPTNTYRIWTDRVNSNLTEVEVFDNSATSSTNFSAAMSGAVTPSPGYYLGGIDPSLTYVTPDDFHGDLAEWIYYKGYLSDADRLAVLGYLQQKYYLTSVTNGVSFQWQFDGANIDGATNATLTLTDFQTNEAGAYSVIVSSLEGSATSSNAVLTVYVAPPCAPAPAGIVGWWPAEGNANDIVGGNNGVLTGGASFGPGVVGLAFVLNGINQYIAVPDAPLLRPSSFTTEGWYNFQAWDNDRVLVAKPYGPGTFDSYALWIQNGQLRGAVVTGDTQQPYLTYDWSPSFGTWHHVAYSYDQDASIQKLYVDGVAAASNSASGTISYDTHPFQIGADIENGVPAFFFDGSIDEVSLYNRALSDSEIAGIFAAGSAGKCAISGSIIIQPQSQAAAIGSTVTLSVTATGSPPFNYQWSFDGTKIVGAADSSLVLTNLTASEGGTYAVTVSNTLFTAISSNAVLTVLNPLAITPLTFTNGGFEVPQIAAGTQQDLSSGSTFLAGWLVGGTGGPVEVVNGILAGYQPFQGQQWLSFNSGNTAPGSTISQTFQTTAGQAYGVTFALGSMGVGDVSMTVTVVEPGGTAMASNTFSPAADAWGTDQLSFTALSTNATLLFSDTSAQTVGVDLVLDDVSVGILPPGGPPVVATSPISQTVLEGATVTFTASATGGASSVQWYQGSSEIPGATNTTLVLTAGPGSAGSYTATFNNGWGSATTSPAILTIIEPVAPFTNGGFEVPQITGGTQQDLTSGSTFLTGWQVGGNGGPVEVVNGILAGFKPYEGQQWLSFNSGNTAPGSTISQTFQTTAGQTYGVTFALGSMGVGDVSMTVTVAEPGGPAMASNTFSPPGNAWGTDQLSFTALSTNATLVFSDTSAQTIGVDLVLDDVNVGIAPVITLSPSNQSVTAGSAVTFTGAASGSPPIAYQWQFNGANIAGATNTALTVTNAQAANDGSYRIIASNPSGSTTSSVAILAVDESTIQVVSTSGAGGGSVVVSIDLLALGTESGVGFTLDYDPTVLTFTRVALGSGASGGAPEFNTNQISSGRLGLGAALFSGTFPAGTNDVFDVTFQAAVVTNATTTSLFFGNQPTGEEVSDALAQALPAVYLPGVVVISSSALEGDVSPRPNGDEVLNISDWIQEGRFVAGLDIVSNGSEFQRADCAPRATLGDGQITVADWVQVGRYAVGLDPLTAAGGPTAPVSQQRDSHQPGKDDISHAISLVPSWQSATLSSVTVNLAAQGDESALQFSVTFNPALIRFVNASLGAGATGAGLIQNTNFAASGNLGFVVGLLPPATFAAGTQELVNLNFAPVTYSNTTALVFGGTPIQCQLVDSNTAVLTTSYQNATLAVGGLVWPTLSITQAGNNAVLSWPSSATGFQLQSSASLDGEWSNVAETPATNGARVLLTSPISTNAVYYRLKY